MAFESSREVVDAQSSSELHTMTVVVMELLPHGEAQVCRGHRISASVLRANATNREVIDYSERQGYAGTWTRIGQTLNIELSASPSVCASEGRPALRSESFQLRCTEQGRWLRISRHPILTCEVEFRQGTRRPGEGPLDIDHYFAWPDAQLPDGDPFNVIILGAHGLDIRYVARSNGSSDELYQDAPVMLDLPWISSF